MAVRSVQGRFAVQEGRLIAALRDESLVLELVLTDPRLGRRDDRVPVRTTGGPLDLGLPASRLSPTRAAWYSLADSDVSSDERFDLVNFVEGRDL